MENSNQNIEVLKLRLRDFSSAREWDQFHSVRNLIFALVGEVGELAAEMQWIDDVNVALAISDKSKHDAIASEIADVFSYLVRLADKLEMNLVDEALKKIDLNEKRYPADKAKGSAAKYTAYE